MAVNKSQFGSLPITSCMRDALPRLRLPYLRDQADTHSSTGLSRTGTITRLLVQWGQINISVHITRGLWMGLIFRFRGQRVSDLHKNRLCFRFPSMFPDTSLYILTISTRSRTRIQEPTPTTNMDTSASSLDSTHRWVKWQIREILAL